MGKRITIIQGHPAARGSSLTRGLQSDVRIVALALLPMLAALAGAAIDERLRLGVTIWRASCRASGFAPRSVLVFTLELLPWAVIGALLGGLIVLGLAVVHGRAAHAHVWLAAHFGCVLAMPVGLVLCALALPLSWMLAAEAALAGVAALAMLRVMDITRGGSRRSKPSKPR